MRWTANGTAIDLEFGHQRPVPGSMPRQLAYFLGCNGINYGPFIVQEPFQAFDPTWDFGLHDDQEQEI